MEDAGGPQGAVQGRGRTCPIRDDHQGLKRVDRCFSYTSPGPREAEASFDDPAAMLWFPAPNTRETFVVMSSGSRPITDGTKPGSSPLTAKASSPSGRSSLSS
jgi:hypothetical protein